MASRESTRRFHFLKEIASGGFGSVYLAKVMHADGFSRLAAIKLLHQRWSENAEIAQRMRDEARLLGWLRHRNIVDVIDLTTIGGRVAVIMEYLEAIDFKGAITQVVDSGERMPPRAALEATAFVASALDAAYNRPPYQGEKPLRVIHRDIKPSNIMVDESGTVKVLDFGVARADFDHRESHTQELQFGSVDYMPPERLFFEPETPFSDVYSLGATLYELLALEKLGKAKGRPEKHAQFLADRLAYLRTRCDLDGLSGDATVELIQQMLSYNHENRPSAADLVQRCRALARGFDGEGLTEWAERLIPPLVKAQRDAQREPNPLTDSILSEDSASFKADETYVESSEEGGVVLRADEPVPEEIPKNDARWDLLRQAAMEEIQARAPVAPLPDPPAAAVDDDVDVIDETLVGGETPPASLAAAAPPPASPPPAQPHRTAPASLAASHTIVPDPGALDAPSAPYVKKAHERLGPAVQPGPRPALPPPSQTGASALLGSMPTMVPDDDDVAPTQAFRGPPGALLEDDDPPTAAPETPTPSLSGSGAPADPSSVDGDPPVGASAPAVAPDDPSAFGEESTVVAPPPSPDATLASPPAGSRPPAPATSDPPVAPLTAVPANPPDPTRSVAAPRPERSTERGTSRDTERPSAREPERSTPSVAERAPSPERTPARAPEVEEEVSTGRSWILPVLGVFALLAVVAVGGAVLVGGALLSGAGDAVTASTSGAGSSATTGGASAGGTTAGGASTGGGAGAGSPSAPASVEGGINFVSAAPDTAKISVTCDGAEVNGGTSVGLSAASAQKCAVKVVLSDRTRLVAEVAGAEAGTYRCFEGGAKECVR